MAISWKGNERCAHLEWGTSSVKVERRQWGEATQYDLRSEFVHPFSKYTRAQTLSEHPVEGLSAALARGEQMLQSLLQWVGGGQLPTVLPGDLAEALNEERVAGSTSGVRG